MNARMVVADYTFSDPERARAAAEAAGALEAALGRLKALVTRDIERLLCGETPQRVVPGSQP